MKLMFFFIFKELSGCVSSALATGTTASTTTSASSAAICLSALSNANIAIIGNIIQSYEASETECQYYCQTQYLAGCVAWTFNTESEICQLLSTITGSISSVTR